MTFQEWKDRHAARITDLYFDFLADTDQAADDFPITEFAECLYNQTKHPFLSGLSTWVLNTKEGK